MCIRCNTPSEYDLCDGCYTRYRRVYQKLEAVATQLQQEAYHQQVKGRRKPLKQFNPCSKGVEITKHLSDHDVIVIGVLDVVAATPCGCHNNVGIVELMAMVPDTNELDPIRERP